MGHVRDSVHTGELDRPFGRFGAFGAARVGLAGDERWTSRC